MPTMCTVDMTLVLMILVNFGILYQEPTRYGVVVKSCRRYSVEFMLLVIKVHFYLSNRLIRSEFIIRSSDNYQRTSTDKNP